MRLYIKKACREKVRNHSKKRLTREEKDDKILKNNKARRLTLSPVGCRLHGSILSVISAFYGQGVCSVVQQTVFRLRFLLIFRLEVLNN